jgi:hypothetical protein
MLRAIYNPPWKPSDLRKLLAARSRGLGATLFKNAPGCDLSVSESDRRFETSIP